MIKQKTLTAALLALGVFASVEYAAVAQTPSTTQPYQPANGQNRTSLSASDKDFMVQAAQGGMAEVQLGQMALKQAKSAEVKQYAQHMIQEHTKVNKELMALAARKGVTLPKTVNSQQMAVMTRLSKLSGTNFDQAYMNEAGVKSHAQQQALFQRQVQQGQNRDVTTFATKTLPAVQEHLEMARAMTGATTGSNTNRPASAQ